MNNMENQIILSENNRNSTEIFTIVQVADDTYALDSRHVLEIIKFVELTCPERLPSHIAGLFEYNQKIISIVDIKSVLKLKRSPYDINSMIVVMKVGDNVFGLMVNKVLDIKKIDMNNLQPTPYVSRNNFISAIYNNNENQCAVINLDTLNSWLSEHRDDEEDVQACSLVPSDEYSKEILHERKLEFIEKSQKNPYAIFADKDEFVSFSCADNKYCLKMNDIKGFYKAQETKITKVPCTPRFISGLVNIKGDFITVVDIKNYFHAQEPSYNPSGTIIILNSDEFKIGILADTIGDNLQIKPEEIQSINKQDTKGELAQYVREGEIFLIINVKEMLLNDKLFIR